MCAQLTRDDMFAIAKFLVYKNSILAPTMLWQQKSNPPNNQKSEVN